MTSPPWQDRGPHGGAGHRHVGDEPQLFQSVAETALDAIITADLDGKIHYANPAAHRMFARGDERLEGRPLTDLMPARYREAHEKGISRYRATGKGHVIGTVVEMHGRRPDGSEFPIELALSAWTGSRGRMVTGIVRDVSERHRARAELERHAADLAASNRDLEAFAYVASHDLQEPLRMVASYLGLIERRYNDLLDEDGRQFIAYAVDGARRMQQLIHDLLEFSRIGTRGNAPEATDVGEALERTLEALGPAIEEAGAVVKATQLPKVMADPVQLRQVLQNLVANAVKFRAKAAPKIDITAERVGRFWRLRVADNGIGIARKDQERVFQLFQRLHTREEYPGMGMGLAICRRIIERHGGELGVESERGEGATFYFTLPAIPEVDA